jgi:uroporphyrinogen-III decarboxylase
MLEVLERIQWYREVTNDQLPICLTDTQSPHDTASLLMETNNFFLECSHFHEKYKNFLHAITDLIIEFSEKQMEAIGPRLSLPGHQMLCHPDFKGISISDDNMVMLSPRTYEATSLPYLQKIAAHFGGIAVHSCGNVTHNIPNLLKIEGLESIKATPAQPHRKTYRPDMEAPGSLRKSASIKVNPAYWKSSWQRI